jgi:hypothetical protein
MLNAVISFLAQAPPSKVEKGALQSGNGWMAWKLLLTLRLNYDEYGNHINAAQPKSRENNRRNQE